MTAPARQQLKVWPVVLLALPAAVSIWSGWVGLGQMTGFGKIRPFPGTWLSDWQLDTAITLPIGMEAYAAYALHVWLSGRAPARAVAFARRSAIGALVLGAAGQVAYHLMSAAGVERAPWLITTGVACLPVAVLGMGAALAHLIRSAADVPDDAPELVTAEAPSTGVQPPAPVEGKDVVPGDGGQLAPPPARPPRGRPTKPAREATSRSTDEEDAALKKITEAYVNERRAADRKATDRGLVNAAHAEGLSLGRPRARILLEEASKPHAVRDTGAARPLVLLAVVLLAGFALEMAPAWTVTALVCAGVLTVALAFAAFLVVRRREDRDNAARESRLHWVDRDPAEASGE